MVTIREEQKGDEAQIREVNEITFGQPNEANIVDKLRISCDVQISLVAEVDNKIVGHILFTPVTIENKEGEIEGMGLAPMAVLPEFQKQKIGTKLVEIGLEIVNQKNYPFVVVLGHPDYYPKFGFEKASNHGVKSEYKNVPDESFMISILNKNELDRIKGIAKYCKEFNEAV